MAQRNLPQRRIGIIGGMGPMAGVRLQEFIVKRTLATCDQDHLEVICFTNPHIPDRTTALARDGGDSFVAAIRQSIVKLARMDVDIIAIPCHTAHARFDDIARDVSVPVMSIVELTMRAVVAQVGNHGRVALFATEGTVRSGIYQRAMSTINWIVPSANDQRQIARIIAETKAGRQVPTRVLNALVARAIVRGADAVVLACTELSLYATKISPARVIIDPLIILADALIAFGLDDKRERGTKQEKRAPEREPSPTSHVPSELLPYARTR